MLKSPKSAPTELLSPTENAAPEVPETPRQQFHHDFCDFLTSHYITQSHICILCTCIHDRCEANW